MLDELFKTDWNYFWEFVGGPKGGLAGIGTAIGIIGMAFSFRGHNKNIAQTNIAMVKMDTTMVELTNALITTASTNKALIEALERRNESYRKF
jgi:hypothetical protein